MASVGELLDLADRQARDLLHEAPYRDGKALLRSWGEVVHAAGGLWRAIPDRGRAASAHVRPVGVMDQLESHVGALQRVVRARRSVDSDLETIAGLFTRAHAAVEAAGVTSLRTPAAAGDAFAARVSIMHTLYLTGHAVSLGLRHVEPLDPEGTTRLRAGVDAATDLALSYHQGAYPDALAQVHRDWIDPDRLGQTVSAWDLATHRVLAGSVTGRDVETVVGTALVATSHARVLWRLAHENGHADAAQFRTRLGPALDASAQGWAKLHGMLRPLVHPTERPTQELLTLSTDLRCALGQLASDRLAAGSHASLAALVDLSEATSALRRFHSSATGVAAEIQVVLERGEVSVNAVAANRLVRDLGEGVALSDPARAAIDPRAVFLRRPVPLHGLLRGPLAEAASDVLRTCETIHQSTAQSVQRPCYRQPAPGAPGHRAGPPRAELRALPETSRAPARTGISR